MMRSHKLVRTTLLIGLLAGALWLSRSIAAAEQPAAAAANPKSAAGAAASDQGALFTAFVPVLRHPRCMNCHSNGDFPRQGDDGHPHAMNVRRGPEGHGVTAEKCSTCHQDHNLVGAHLPPGAPNWGLPPASTPMIWQGLTDSQIASRSRIPSRTRTGTSSNSSSILRKIN